jgi:hypothetical protein
MSRVDPTDDVGIARAHGHRIGAEDLIGEREAGVHPLETIAGLRRIRRRSAEEQHHGANKIQPLIAPSRIVAVPMPRADFSTAATSTPLPLNVPAPVNVPLIVPARRQTRRVEPR